jgi:hypothetical protein
MGAPNPLTALRGMGLTISAHGGELHVAPRAAITDEARRIIRAHKPEILAALIEPQPVDHGDDYTLADLAKLDDLLRQLAELEDWPLDELEKRLGERRRMAPVNVMPTLRALQDAVQRALAVWPERPTWKAEVRLLHMVH